MSLLTQRARAGFARVLRSAGKLREYRRKSGGGVYDPTTGGISSPTTEVLQLRCVMLSQTQTQTGEGQDRFQRVALLPDAIGVPPVPLNPNDGDEIVDGARVYTLGDLAPHEVGGTVVGWRAMVRAGR